METSSRRLPALSLPQTLTIGIIASVGLFSLTKEVSTIDLSIFLSMGRKMVATGKLLEIEHFSMTALDARFQNGTWLAQLVLYGLYSWGGYPALQMLLSFVASLTLLAVWLEGRISRSFSVVGVALAASFLLQNLAIRPQSFALPLFAWTSLLLHRFANRRVTPLLLFALMALWSNLHGSFPIAFLLVGAQFVDSLLHPRPQEEVRQDSLKVPPGWKRWLVLAGVMLAGSLANPYGAGIYQYILENSAGPVSKGFSEWLPPEPLSFLGLRFAASVLFMLALAILKRRQSHWIEVLLLIAFAVLGAQSQRMIVWWGLVSGPIAVRWLSCDRKEPARKADPLHTGLGWAMIAFWILLFSVSFPKNTMSPYGDYVGLDDATPVQAAATLRQRPMAHIFNRLEWGGYLSFKLYPRIVWTFIDIRAWIFTDEIWEQYLQISRAEPGWDVLLDHYMIDVAFLSQETQSRLIEALRQRPEWHLIHEDPLAVVFVRDFQPKLPW